MSSFGQTAATSSFSFEQFASLGADVLPANQGKLINIGTNGQSGSTTIVNIGSPNGGNAIVNLYGQIITPAAPQSGTSAQRPTSTYIGQFYFDTTLGFPIWASVIGTTWVDAAGASV